MTLPEPPSRGHAPVQCYQFPQLQSSSPCQLVVLPASLRGDTRRCTSAPQHSQRFPGNRRIIEAMHAEPARLWPTNGGQTACHCQLRFSSRCQYEWDNKRQMSNGSDSHCRAHVTSQFMPVISVKLICKLLPYLPWGACTRAKKCF